MMIALAKAFSVKLAAAMFALAIAGSAQAGGLAPGIAGGWKIQRMDSATLATYLGRMRTLGATWLRFDFAWSYLQPVPPTPTATFDAAAIAQTDMVVNQIVGQQIQVTGIIDYTTPWAQISGSDTPVDISYFSAYARALVARYKANVHVWEIWNEPNLAVFWQGQASPEGYADLLQATYLAIKQEDPTATVLMGGLAPAADNGTDVNGITFLKRVYQRIGAGYFDALSYHPYTFPYMPSDTQSWNSFYQMQQARDLMVAYGDSAKKIWITEIGAPTCTGSTYCVSETQQSSIIVDGWKQALQRPWIDHYFVYSMIDLGNNTKDLEQNFGLLRYNGSQKKAFSDFRVQIQAAMVATTAKIRR